MFVIFGWLKEAVEVDSSLKCYCYQCQRLRIWEHWQETEWVSFFYIKTIPFMRKNYVLCTACRDPLQLDRAQIKWLATASKIPALVEFVEQHQLAGKTELQRNFLLAQRQQVESRNL